MSDETSPAPAPGAAPAPRDVPTDQTNIIAQQLILLATQAQLVRDLETDLDIAPPGPTPPVPPPPIGTNLQNVIDTQTAAIRTQAAYTRHLQDLAVALGITPTSSAAPTKQ